MASCGKHHLPSHQQQQQQQVRAECVLQMSPTVVGWVIGKGGQRIRDLMEESGAKVWIDQEKIAKTNDAFRNVYISGERKCVDQAVRMVREIVAQAPSGDERNHESTEPISSSPNMAVNHQQLSQEAAAAAAHPSVAMTMAPNIAAEITAQHVLTCEARFVPLLIGKRGWTIKHIQDESGARVDIDQTVTPRQIRISGSKANVETAIGMVRDVLSYPHAQLLQSSGDPSGEMMKQTIHNVPDQQLLGTSTVLDGVLHQSSDRAIMPHARASQENDDRHSPPPSSLIMTGDAKSLISASSSLSSTPEPSMASTSKGYCTTPLHTGPLIPPDYGGTSNHLQPQPLGNAFMLQEMGMADAAGARGFSGGGVPLYGGSGHLMGMHHHIPGMGMPSHPQQVYGQQAPKPAIPPMGGNMNQMPGGFATGPNMAMRPDANNTMHQGLDFGMMARNNAPMPVHHQHNAMHPPPAASHFNRFSSMPDNGLRNAMPGENLARAQSAFGGSSEIAGNTQPRGLIWNPSLVPKYESPGLPQSSEGYYMDGLRQQNIQERQRTTGAMPLGFDVGHQSIGDAKVPFASPSLDPATNVVLESRGDDSRMVDSLFGPAGGGNNRNTVVEQQSLLTGLNGLSINGDTGLGVAGAGLGVGGAGLWSSSLADWDANDKQRAAVPLSDTKKDAVESTVFAGLQPLQQMPQHQQHPSESRFNWSSTNA
jgi:far upstream element-binding protein